MTDMVPWDVVIVGGGPAGLSAALILGRCRRRVLVCDDHHPRNASSKAMHGYLSRDGIPPLEFLLRARKEILKYGTEFRECRAVEVSHENNQFTLTLSSGETVRGKKLLIATGMRDDLPRIENLDLFYGTSVFHCPYCDGWENQDRSIAVYGKGRKGASLALTLVQWSSRITLCTDGEWVDGRYKPVLTRNRILWREEPILRLEGDHGQLDRVIFNAGPPLNVSALFFNTEKGPQSRLGEHLGCYTVRSGDLVTDDLQKTRVSGVYVAGDAADDLKLVILAAAEGAKAAFAINTELMDEKTGRLPD